jgi:hypothetical protein
MKFRPSTISDPRSNVGAADPGQGGVDPAVRLTSSVSRLLDQIGCHARRSMRPRICPKRTLVKWLSASCRTEVPGMSDEAPDAGPPAGSWADLAHRPRGRGGPRLVQRPQGARRRVRELRGGQDQEVSARSYRRSASTGSRPLGPYWVVPLQVEVPLDKALYRRLDAGSARRSPAW